MTVVEAAGLAVVIVVGVVRVGQGGADFGALVDFSSASNPIWAMVAGVALAFFAMTGFENAANVAEETIEPESATSRGRSSAACSPPASSTSWSR